MEYSYNCKNLKHFLLAKINGNLYPVLEVHGDTNFQSKLILDIRTYLCSQGLCNSSHNRSHNRITSFNYKKMLYMKTKEEMNKIILMANGIRNSGNDTNKNYPHENTLTSNISDSSKPYTLGFKQIKFHKATKPESEKTDVNDTLSHKPIELVFDMIDKIAVDNSVKILNEKPKSSLRNSPQNSNCYRMTYGDLNYLGNNKALLYFDRGTQGKQIFTNSMQPLHQQSKHKDLIVVDDIVFTSTCICQSAEQHQKMFPHYRETCAVGLTCPAQLNKIERIIYARKKKAPTDHYTTARQMLIRCW